MRSRTLAGMRVNKLPLVMTLMTICFLVILGFQWFWLSQSRKALEEQFNRQVSMALCAAVGSLEGCSPEHCAMKNEDCLARSGGSLSFSTDCLDHGLVNKSQLEAAVYEALLFYDLPQKFTVDILQENDDHCDPGSPFCCALGPFTASNNQFINIRFPERSSYIWNKLWLMVLSSVLSLLFILFVFLVAIRALWQQQKISEFNVDFFNSMAHEFRTPIASMKLALNRFFLKNPSLSQNPYLKIISSENSKLKANVERVLSLAKLDEGRYELKREKVNIGKLVGQITDDMKIVLLRTGARIIPDERLNRFQVWADPLHLSHALHNLIDNAIKYCDDQPIIEIGIKESNQSIHLIVKDNGVGMNEQDSSLVFKRFVRLGADRNETHGFGLGLAYVKMIMDLHKGTINLWSKKGEGSKFELVFPKILS